MMRTPTTRFLLAVSLALAFAPVRAADAPVPGPALAELEEWAQRDAAEMRVSDADIEAMGARLDAARASEGTLVQAGTSLIHAREPITDTTSHTYERATGAVGLRYPILGTREAQLRNTADAAGALSQARFAREQARANVLRLVRIAVVDEWHARARTAIANAYLSTRGEAQALLDDRERRHEMLPSENRGLLTLYDQARTELTRDEAARAEALSALRRLTGQPVERLADTPPAFAVSCLDAHALLAAADTRPTVAAAKADVAQRQQRGDDDRWGGVEAGVTLAQTVSQDIAGQTGYSTSVGFDVSMPLDWRAARRARAAAAHADLARAQAALDLRMQEDEQDVERAFRDLAVRVDEEEMASRVLEASREEWRVARARLSLQDGDAIGREMHARHELYLSALELENSRQRLEIAQIGVLSLGAACPATAVAQAATGADRQIEQDLRQPVMRGKAASSTAAAASSGSAALTWFAWKGESVVDREDTLASLPAGTTRLWLSFGPERLKRLAAGEGRDALQRRVAAAHARGVQVHLLLGDPGFVLPAGRARLVQLLGSLHGLGVDGLVLDLERSQLSPAIGAPRWREDALATMTAAHAAAPGALALVTHPRDLADAGFVKQLRAAGVDEIVPMIYVPDEARTVTLAEGLLALDPAMGVTLAQSIEPGVAGGPVAPVPGRAEALARWRRIAAKLARHPNFRGIAVQSLEDFAGAAP
jgi:outer membrane protein TolC